MRYQKTRPPAAETPSTLLSESEAAHYLGVSRSFLAKARCRGDGPRFYQIGSAIRYSAETLEAYLRQRSRTVTERR